MHKILILLGSNKGYRYKHLLLAKYFIQNEIGRINSASNIYETEPWQVIGKQSAYLNQCLEVQSTLGIFQLLNATQKIEKRLGRNNKNQNQSRTIDIDILFYDDILFETKKLIIPHPRLHLRKFTLLPLVEIAPDFIHPKMNQRIQELLKNVQDNAEVKRYIPKGF